MTEKIVEQSQDGLIAVIPEIDRFPVPVLLIVNGTGALEVLEGVAGMTIGEGETERAGVGSVHTPVALVPAVRTPTTFDMGWP